VPNIPEDPREWFTGDVEHHQPVRAQFYAGTNVRRGLVQDANRIFQLCEELIPRPGMRTRMAAEHRRFDLGQDARHALRDLATEGWGENDDDDIVEMYYHVAEGSGSLPINDGQVRATLRNFERRLGRCLFSRGNGALYYQAAETGSNYVGHVRSGVSFAAGNFTPPQQGFAGPHLQSVSRFAYGLTRSLTIVNTISGCHHVASQSDVWKTALERYQRNPTSENYEAYLREAAGLVSNITAVLTQFPIPVPFFDNVFSGASTFVTRIGRLLHANARRIDGHPTFTEHGFNGSDPRLRGVRRSAT